MIDLDNQNNYIEDDADELLNYLLQENYEQQRIPEANDNNRNVSNNLINSNTMEYI